MYISLDLVSVAAVFWDVTQRLPLFVIARSSLGREFQSVGDAFMKAPPFKVVLVRTAGVVVLSCYQMTKTKAQYITKIS